MPKRRERQRPMRMLVFPLYFLLREFAIFFFIANSCNIILHLRNIARSRNCSYLGIVLNRGPTLRQTGIQSGHWKKLLVESR